MQIIGETAPNDTEVKFQQKATLVVLMFTGNVSATTGFNIPSVRPIKTPIKIDITRIVELSPVFKEDING